MMHGTTAPHGSRWIPWSFFIFFAVVFGANGIMLFFALDSWTGLSTENAFQRGLAYNEQIAERDRQAELGWQVSFKATADRPGHMVFDMQVGDDRGVPVAAAAVAVSLTRPTHEGHDSTATLAHMGSGHYVGEADVSLPGQRRVELIIDEPRGRYRRSARVVVP